MIGACDGFNDFYSLRFVPSQNRFSFEKTSHASITTSSDVPITLAPNTDYVVEILAENSMFVVHINNSVALSCRIYRHSKLNWGIYADNSDVNFKNIIG